MNIINLIKKAGAFAIKREDYRDFLVGAVAVRADGAIVVSRNGNTLKPVHASHAENRLMKKAGHGSTVVVVRIRHDDGETAMAKPCLKCQALLKAKGVTVVYYTNGPGNEYEMMKF